MNFLSGQACESQQNKGASLIPNLFNNNTQQDLESNHGENKEKMNKRK